SPPRERGSMRVGGADLPRGMLPRQRVGAGQSRSRRSRRRTRSVKSSSGRGSGSGGAASELIQLMCSSSGSVAAVGDSSVAGGVEVSAAAGSRLRRREVPLVDRLFRSDGLVEDLRLRDVPLPEEPSSEASGAAVGRSGESAWVGASGEGSPPDDSGGNDSGAGSGWAADSVADGSGANSSRPNNSPVDHVGDGSASVAGVGAERSTGSTVNRASVVAE